MPSCIEKKLKEKLLKLIQLTKCDPDFIAQLPNGFDENDKKTRDKCLYLKQLLADKRTAAQMPGVFLHMERLLDDGKFFFLLETDRRKKWLIWRAMSLWYVSS